MSAAADLPWINALMRSWGSFGQIAIGTAVSRNRQSNRGGRQAVRLARGVLRHHRERDLSGDRYGSPSLRGISLQLGGKMDDTRTRFLGGNACIAQC